MTGLKWWFSRNCANHCNPKYKPENILENKETCTCLWLRRLNRSPNPNEKAISCCHGFRYFGRTECEWKKMESWKIPKHCMRIEKNYENEGDSSVVFGKFLENFTKRLEEMDNEKQWKL